MSRPVHWRCGGTTACGQHDARYQDLMAKWIDQVTCPECIEVHAAHEVIVAVKVSKAEAGLDVLAGAMLDGVAMSYGLVRKRHETDGELRQRMKQLISRNF